MSDPKLEKPQEETFAALLAGLSEEPLGHCHPGFDILGEPLKSILRDLARAEDTEGGLTPEIQTAARNRLGVVFSSVAGVFQSELNYLGDPDNATAFDIQGRRAKSEAWLTRIDAAFRSRSLLEKLQLFCAIRSYVSEAYRDERSR